MTKKVKIILLSTAMKNRSVRWILILLSAIALLCTLTVVSVAASKNEIPYNKYSSEQADSFYADMTYEFDRFHAVRSLSVDNDLKQQMGVAAQEKEGAYLNREWKMLSREENPDILTNLVAEALGTDQTHYYHFTDSINPADGNVNIVYFDQTKLVPGVCVNEVLLTRSVHLESCLFDDEELFIRESEITTRELAAMAIHFEPTNEQGEPAFLIKFVPVGNQVATDPYYLAVSESGTSENMVYLTAAKRDASVWNAHTDGKYKYFLETFVPYFNCYAFLTYDNGKFFMYNPGKNVSVEEMGFPDSLAIPLLRTERDEIKLLKIVTNDNGVMEGEPSSDTVERYYDYHNLVNTMSISNLKNAKILNLTYHPASPMYSYQEALWSLDGKVVSPNTISSGDKIFLLLTKKYSGFSYQKLFTSYSEQNVFRDLEDRLTESFPYGAGAAVLYEWNYQKVFYSLGEMGDTSHSVQVMRSQDRGASFVREQKAGGSYETYSLISGNWFRFTLPTLEDTGYVYDFAKVEITSGDEVLYYYDKNGGTTASSDPLLAKRMMMADSWIEFEDDGRTLLIKSTPAADISIKITPGYTKAVPLKEYVYAYTLNPGYSNLAHVYYSESGMDLNVTLNSSWNMDTSSDGKPFAIIPFDPNFDTNTAALEQNRNFFTYSYVWHASYGGSDHVYPASDNPNATLHLSTNVWGSEDVSIWCTITKKLKITGESITYNSDITHALLEGYPYRTSVVFSETAGQRTSDLIYVALDKSASEYNGKTDAELDALWDTALYCLVYRDGYLAATLTNKESGTFEDDLGRRHTDTPVLSIPTSLRCFPYAVTQNGTYEFVTVFEKGSHKTTLTVDYLTDAVAVYGADTAASVSDNVYIRMEDPYAFRSIVACYVNVVPVGESASDLWTPLSEETCFGVGDPSGLSGYYYVFHVAANGRYTFRLVDDHGKAFTTETLTYENIQTDGYAYLITTDGSSDTYHHSLSFRYNDGDVTVTASVSDIPNLDADYCKPGSSSGRDSSQYIYTYQWYVAYGGENFQVAGATGETSTFTAPYADGQTVEVFCYITATDKSTGASFVIRTDNASVKRIGTPTLVSFLDLNSDLTRLSDRIWLVPDTAAYEALGLSGSTGNWDSCTVYLDGKQTAILSLVSALKYRDTGKFIPSRTSGESLDWVNGFEYTLTKNGTYTFVIHSAVCGDKSFTLTVSHLCPEVQIRESSSPNTVLVSTSDPALLAYVREACVKYVSLDGTVTRDWTFITYNPGFVQNPTGAEGPLEGYWFPYTISASGYYTFKLMDGNGTEILSPETRIMYKFDVTFETGGRTVEGDGSSVVRKVAEGTALPTDVWTTADSGEVFIGWYDAPEGGTIQTTASLAHTTLYAYWSEPVVSFNQQGKITLFASIADAVAYARTHEGVASLLKDTEEDITVPDGTSFALDLCGKTLRSTGEGSVITVFGHLTLSDSSSDEKGKITQGCYSVTDQCYGAGICVFGGHVVMNGGHITENTPTASCIGGGVFLDGGTFTMNGGFIEANSARNGGGVAIGGGGVFTMNDGVISSNKAEIFGSGIMVNQGSFVMNGGKLLFNYTTCYSGAGIYLLHGSVSASGGCFGNDIVCSDFEDITISLSGGCFSYTPPSSYLASGVAVASNPDSSTATGYPYILVTFYSVSWLSHDGTPLTPAGTAAKGTLPTYTGLIPTREANAQYSYTFAGWATEPGQTEGLQVEDLPVVTGNIVYYAAFARVVNTYPVQWKGVDDQDLLETDSGIPYGTFPSYEGQIPTKAKDSQYTYTFAGWATEPGQTKGMKAKDLPAVTGSVVYYAAFKYSVAPSYTVTIPSEVNLGENITVSAENVVLEKGKTLTVAITETSDANNEFKLKTTEGAELTYTVKTGDTPVSVGTAFLTVNPETSASGSATLSFVAPTSAPQFAGEYEGTVTFGISIQ